MSKLALWEDKSTESFGETESILLGGQHCVVVVVVTEENPDRSSFSIIWVPLFCVSHEGRVKDPNKQDRTLQRREQMLV